MRAPEFWHHRGPLALLLAPLGFLYGLSIALKAKMARPARVRARVICVGNLTAGGSGKTPVAMAVAQRLIARSDKVFFLTRGYGGSETGPLLVKDQTAAQVGDEALLLARIAPTIVAADRAAGAALAVAQGATTIVMDDGHQNFSLAKDISLVVVRDFGNGFLIPAGPLRETPRRGFARADAVILTGDTAPPPAGFSGPVLQTRLTVDGAEFQGRRVFAFAGIGRPQNFVTSLRTAGAEVTGTRFFADHHPYSDLDVAGLRLAAGSALLVTTEKDHARLSPGQRGGIAVLKMRLEFTEPHLLDSLLGPV